MQTIEVSEASAKLFALVADVEAGDEVLLTRDGRVVASISPRSVEDPRAAQHLLPATKVADGPSELTPEEQARARKALVGIKLLAEELNLGPFDLEEFKRDRDEGRL